MSWAISRIALLAAVIVAALLAPGALSMKLELRNAPANAPQLPNDWKGVFKTLATLVRDDEFQNSLRDFLRDHGNNGPVNYCLLTAVTCDENYYIESLTLTNIDGSLDFAHVPKGTVSVTVANSSLRQTLDLSQLPFWVRSVKIERVKFFDGTTRFEKKHSTLNTLIVRDCGLTSVDWGTMPALVYLDLSNNPITAFAVEKLPPTLRHLNLSHCRLSADVPTLQSLPPPLMTLDLSDNQLSGRITSVTFPLSLEHVSLRQNAISGDLVLDNFPFTLSYLDVAHNDLSGVLNDLSPFLALKHIDVANNKIDIVRWEKLPPQLQHLAVSSNLVRGGIDVSVLPSTLLFMDVHSNKLTGSLDLAKLPQLLEYFDVSYNELSGPLDLAHFSDAMRFIYLQHNKFTGNPDLTNLPVHVRRILIFKNNWDSLMPPK